MHRRPRCISLVPFSCQKTCLVLAAMAVAVAVALRLLRSHRHHPFHRLGHDHDRAFLMAYSTNEQLAIVTCTNAGTSPSTWRTVGRSFVAGTSHRWRVVVRGSNNRHRHRHRPSCCFAMLALVAVLPIVAAVVALWYPKEKYCRRYRFRHRLIPCRFCSSIDRNNKANEYLLPSTMVPLLVLQPTNRICTGGVQQLLVRTPHCLLIRGPILTISSSTYRRVFHGGLLMLRMMNRYL